MLSRPNKEKERSQPPGRFSTIYEENPFANARSKCMSFFTDRNKTPSYATCKNCGGDDHDFKSCMERPKDASLFKKVKPMTPAKAVKNKKIIQVKLEQKQHRRWNFDPNLASANDSFVVGGQIQKEVSAWTHESERKLVSVENLQEQEKSLLEHFLEHEEL